MNIIIKYKIEGEWYMKKHKLNIRYHNPNGEVELAEHLTKIFVEASKIKFEKILQDSSNSDYLQKQKSPG